MWLGHQFSYKSFEHLPPAYCFTLVTIPHPSNGPILFLCSHMPSFSAISPTLSLHTYGPSLPLLPCTHLPQPSNFLTVPQHWPSFSLLPVFLLHVNVRKSLGVLNPCTNQILKNNLYILKLFYEAEVKIYPDKPVNIGKVKPSSFYEISIFIKRIWSFVLSVIFENNLSV